jgi:hypothetical protein
MTPEEVQTLPHGVYIIHWKSGEISLASVGSKNNGDRWIACCNWVNSDKNTPNYANHEIWSHIKKVGLIAQSTY